MMQFTVMVHAVVVRGDQILTVIHDRGLGAFLGLPREYVRPENPIHTTVELAVLAQTSLDITAGRLLGVDYVSTDGFYPYSEMHLAIECSLKRDDEPKLPEDYDGSDSSIFNCQWVEIEEFMKDTPPIRERQFWNHVVRAYRGEERVDLYEINLDDYRKSR